MKKKDVYIIGFGILLALAAFSINGIKKDTNDGEVIIWKDGTVFQILPLNYEGTVTVKDDNGNRNVVGIHGGSVSVIDANCPDRICMHTRPIRSNGQSIVCLPHRVVVEIRSKKEDIIDGISQ